MNRASDLKRLKEVLSEKHHTSLETLFKLLSADGAKEMSCSEILQHFITIDDELSLNEPRYIRDLEEDFFCLVHIFRGTRLTQKEIRALLEVLAETPNRKLVAARVLLGRLYNNSRKRVISLNNKLVVTKHPKIDTNIEAQAAIKSAQNAKDVTPSISLIGPEVHSPKIDKKIKVNAFVGPARISAGLDEIINLGDSTEDVLIAALTAASGPILKKEINQLGDPVPLAPINSAVINGTVIVLNDSINEATNQPAPEQDEPLPASPVVVDRRLTRKVIEMFPDVSRDYVEQICKHKAWDDTTFAQIVDIMLGTDYPRRPEREPSPEPIFDPNEGLEWLKAVLPDADPTYLEKIVEKAAGNKELLRQFIDQAIEQKNYPTMKEYLRKTQLSSQQKQYTVDFNIERFVELFPDPVAVFENPQRATTIKSWLDKDYVERFMRKAYPLLYVSDVAKSVGSSLTVFSVVTKLEELVSKKAFKKTKYVPYRYHESKTENIPLLQELSYFEHKQEILNFLKMKKEQEIRERQQAKELGQLKTCGCCFDDEVMIKDILMCTGGCQFCGDCIKRSTEINVGEGKTTFSCLSSGCQAEFDLHVLQKVLPPKMFSKVAQKKALAEVKAAGLEDLESCPFCDFANIPARPDKVFRCLNPECMKESCRLCKEPSHVPLRCDEVEKDEAVKARTYIEDKMTEALVRQCWKCGTKFIKEEGCNKMVCSCGAMMCYICRKPVSDYKHFNGQGGDRFDLCPLYSDNYSVNEMKVLSAAIEARKQVDPDQLKHDPTVGLEEQLKVRSNKVSPVVQQNHPAAPVVPNDVNYRAQGAVPRHVVPDQYRAGYILRSQQPGQAAPRPH